MDANGIGWLLDMPRLDAHALAHMGQVEVECRLERAPRRGRLRAEVPSHRYTDVLVVETGPTVEIPVQFRRPRAVTSVKFCKEVLVPCDPWDGELI